MPASWTPCAGPAAMTPPGWPSTRKARGTGTRSCGTHQLPRARPRNWVRTARPAHSTSERCASRPGPSPPPPPGLYDAFATEASLLDRWPDSLDARERALGLWRQTGDRLREGDSLRWLACALNAVSRGRDALGAAEAAVALLEPLGSSAELASAYSSLASLRMVNYQHAGAIELAHRAQAIAGPLGLTEVLSDAFNSEACSVQVTGGDWFTPMRRALD